MIATGKFAAANAAALVVSGLLVALPPATWAADRPLFPSPLHITREIHDPVSDTITTIQEYYHGDRVVSVRGDLTSIADYAKGELTEIDRGGGTYSISRFEEIARALAITSPEQSVSATASRSGGEKIELRDRGRRTLAGRAADLVEVESPAVTAAIALDREVVLSAAAFEVVVGAAYPNLFKREHRLVAAAARQWAPISAMAAGLQPDTEEYRLPLEQTFSYVIDGETLQLRNTVSAVNSELPPPEILVIPRGARRVEGGWVERARMLEQLERP